MRAGREGSLIVSGVKSGKQVIGINLGADYCAEHEWGIEDIQCHLGINKDAKEYGLPRKQVTKQSPLLFWIDKKKIGKVEYSGFALYRFWNGVEEWTPREFYPSNKEGDFYSGWAKGGFYVLTASNNKKMVEALTAIHKALDEKNACIWLGGGGVFQNAGLCIGIVDAMPKEIFNGWAAGDKDREDLKAEFDATGIEKLLRDAKKDWFYLGPKRNSEGKMIIWLNPREQDIHNSGYFTVQQLKQWAHNTGPVMMSETDKKTRGRY